MLRRRQFGTRFVGRFALAALLVLMLVAAQGAPGKIQATSASADNVEVSRVLDINSTSPGSNPAGLTDVDGTLFFGAEDFTRGLELWKSDGTAAGTVLVKDINPGLGGSKISEPTDVGGVLFFSATNGVSGEELWKSDGTAAGTFMVKP